MAQIEIRLPKMGESVTEATITNWLKNIGDTVEIDEPLVEVATDKVDNELPSEFSGVLIKRLFEKDQVAKVGEVIAILSNDGADVSDTGSVNAVTQEVTASSQESNTISSVSK
jgi:2-oxoglutarate dehydrogenase E2 component (dihydrolipoamide succinyltransferase)